MECENVIEVKDIKKKFKVYYDKGYMLKEKVIGWKRNRYEERWVLNGVSFNVKRGEAVGIIGHNGCGKSTTLKLLTKIIYPDSGEIIMNGRVSSLIELGAGFHPDLSGRENIYINASIFGLTKSEIDKRVNDIIEFSELQEFIDNPIRTYSSGMYMRLAFSVAINVDADILLIDEILAVGDANFQAKCFEKMMEIKKKGTTIVLVSHSLGQIEQICDRTIWIHKGLIKTEGAPHVVHCQYLDYMSGERQKAIEAEKAKVRVEEEEKRVNRGAVTIKKVSLMDTFGNERNLFDTAEDISVNIECDVKQQMEKAVFSICITRSDGLYCYGGTSRCDDAAYIKLTKDVVVRSCLQSVGLLAGKYDISIGIEDEKGNSINYMGNACSFEIRNRGGVEGAFLIKNSWKALY